MTSQPRIVHAGDSGHDIVAYKRTAHRMAIYTPVVHFPWTKGERLYGPRLAASIAKLQRTHKVREKGIGPKTFALLAPHMSRADRSLLAYQSWLIRRVKPPVYPLATKGEVIGRPYQGTHDHPNPTDPLHNWESCNAVDVAATKGTPVKAINAGVIGSQIGPLDSTNPALLGQRLHLVRSDGKQEWYYAHLDSLLVKAGQHVVAGQMLGYSGVANGVAHLHLAQRTGDPGVVIRSPTSGYVDHHYP